MAYNKDTQIPRPVRVSHGGNTFTNTLGLHRHCWRNDPDMGFLEPVWPREPDLEVTRQLAIAHLPYEYSDASIASFSQGAFHRLYSLSSPAAAKEYLMRVALPVDPFFKTESEVATIQYVREHTQLPVSHIVAFSSSTSNPLGFEWILMERVNGIPIDEVWDDMPFEAKMAFTEDLANMIKPLMALRFSLFGNLYFADVWNQVGYIPLLNPIQDNKDTAITDVDIGMDGEYVIGRMVSTKFFRDKSLLLSTNNRGPFRTVRDLVLAETDLLGKRLTHLSPNPDDDYHSGCDKELAAAGPEVHEVFNKFQGLVSRTSPGSIFPPTPSADQNYASSGIKNTPPEDIKLLWHDDLSRMNILIDPTTYRLTGIVDWESVSIIPAWQATPTPASSSPFANPDIDTFATPAPLSSSTFADPDTDPFAPPPEPTTPNSYTVPIPYFLHGIEVSEPPPREEVTDEEEEEYYAEIRKDWEMGLLRRRYCELVPPLFELGRGMETETDRGVGDRLRVIGAKKKVAEALGDFEDRWEATRYALREGLFEVDGQGGEGDEDDGEGEVQGKGEEDGEGGEGEGKGEGEGDEDRD